MEDPYGEGEKNSEEPSGEPSEEPSDSFLLGKNSSRSEDEEVQPESSDNTVPIPWWAGAFGACPDMTDGAEARGFYVRRFCELFFPDDTAGATEVGQGLPLRREGRASSNDMSEK